ncbi:TOBE-like domain-containing protein [Sinorhizobium glycinis]|uniref:TOBE-like domain-containing protein n=1 Tax=Sinorhizobium glycinis TaxID=1472378 RepID=UPI00138FAC50
MRANAAASIPATIQRVNSAGPTVQLELARVDDGTPLTAELSKEESSELNLMTGATVYVELTKVRVFAEDESLQEAEEGAPDSAESGGTPSVATVSGLLPRCPAREAVPAPPPAGTAFDGYGQSAVRRLNWLWNSRQHDSVRRRPRLSL